MNVVVKEEEDIKELSELYSTIAAGETLLLTEIKNSDNLFCRRLQYSVTVQESDLSSSNSDVKLEVKPSISKSSETADEKFVCKLCGSEIAHRGNMLRHMQIHSRETPYVCELCGVEFRRKEQLKVHSGIHAGKKQQRLKTFSCDQCEKTYTCSNDLQAHLNKHSGERPFMCVLCGKRYTDHRNLNRHRVDSHSEKRFCCFLCGNKFSRQDTLLKHMRIHTGERPYSCPDCGKTFPYKYCLNSHRKRHLKKN